MERGLAPSPFKFIKKNLKNALKNINYENKL